MSNKIQGLKQSILGSIEIIVNNKIRSLPFDRTFIVPVTKSSRNSSTAYITTVIIDSNSYDIITDRNFSVGETVKVRIPCNNWSNMYIEHNYTT